MRLLILFFLLFALSCSSSQKKTASYSIQKHYISPLDSSCSLSISSPLTILPKTRIIVVQAGSNAFSFDEGFAHSVLSKISPEIAKNHFILEVDQPGIVSSLSPHLQESRLSWRTLSYKDGLEIHRLRQNFLWTSQEYAQCYLSAIKKLTGLSPKTPLILLGNSMGADIMLRVLREIQKNQSDFSQVEKVYLTSPMLEPAQALLKRQIAKFNELNKGKTSAYTETYIDPQTKEKVSKTYEEPIEELRISTSWKKIINLKTEDFPQFQHLPNTNTLNKLYMPYSDFSNFYLQGLHKSGHAGKILLALKPKHTKVFLYQGLNDWLVDPHYAKKLQNVTKSTNVLFRYYNADHDLFANTQFLEEIRKDTESL